MVEDDRFANTYRNSNQSFLFLTDRIKPVALADSDFLLDGGVPVTVSGWGRTNDNSSVSESLNYVQLTTITNQQCAETYGNNLLYFGYLCAVGKPHHSVCFVS